MPKNHDFEKEQKKTNCTIGLSFLDIAKVQSPASKFVVFNR